jgi:hypothetical protein
MEAKKRVGIAGPFFMQCMSIEIAVRFVTTHPSQAYSAVLNRMLMFS